MKDEMPQDLVDEDHQPVTRVGRDGYWSLFTDMTAGNAGSAVQ